jgi:hypothetical protein
LGGGGGGPPAAAEGLQDRLSCPLNPAACRAHRHYPYSYALVVLGVGSTYLYGVTLAQQMLSACLLQSCML